MVQHQQTVAQRHRLHLVVRHIPGLVTPKPPPVVGGSRAHLPIAAWRPSWTAVRPNRGTPCGWRTIARPIARLDAVRQTTARGLCSQQRQGPSNRPASSTAGECYVAAQATVRRPYAMFVENAHVWVLRVILEHHGHVAFRTGSRLVTSRPPRIIWPAVGVRAGHQAQTASDCRAEAPTITSISPSASVRSMPCSTSIRPKLLRSAERFQGRHTDQSAILSERGTNRVVLSPPQQKQPLLANRFRQPWEASPPVCARLRRPAAKPTLDRVAVMRDRIEEVANVHGWIVSAFHATADPRPAYRHPSGC